jgi:retron-type reverse transcriptase
MRRSTLDLETVADWRNLTAAFHAASRGKRERPEVAAFARNLDAELSALRAEIVSGEIRVGPMKSFWIRDPKLRLIHAPCFRDRVLHHALMSFAGPELERALIFDTYACRIGKGTLAAVRRCQQHARRFPLFAKIDIKGFFPSVDHDVLQALLARRFKNQRLLRVFSQIIAGYAVQPGKGLPIGALTSQHFANYYLSVLDRFILEAQKVKGFVRYMDDIIWWDETAPQLRSTLGEVEEFAKERLLVEVKQPTQIGRSRDGAMFCGLRVLPGALRLSRRRRKRYAQRRDFWERAFCRGDIGEGALQLGYDAALAITAHASAAGWRREQLRRRPIADPLQGI